MCVCIVLVYGIVTFLSCHVHVYANVDVYADAHDYGDVNAADDVSVNA